MSLGCNMALSILVITIVLLQGSLALSYERQLTGELLQEYSTSARPVKNVSYLCNKGGVVQFSQYIKEIRSVVHSVVYFCERSKQAPCRC